MRLKYDDVNKVPKKRPEKFVKPKAKKSLKDWEGSDFDSEAEYGDEGNKLSDDEEGVEYDDGKAKDSEAGSDAEAGSDESELDLSEVEEMGESEMEEMGESEMSMGEESEGEISEAQEEEDRLDKYPARFKEDLYTVDPFLVRREATML